MEKARQKEAEIGCPVWNPKTAAARNAIVGTSQASICMKVQNPFPLLALFFSSDVVFLSMYKVYLLVNIFHG